MKPILRIAAKSVLWLILSLVSLVLLLALVIQFPFVQNKLVHGVTSFVSGKTHTRVELKHINLSLTKGILLNELFAEDLNHDTLIYVNELGIDINLWQAMNGNISVDKLYLNGLTANITRTLPDSSFNFDFFVQAFSSGTQKNKPIDSTKTSLPNLSVAAIKLSNVRVLYDDAVTGVYSQSHLGNLELLMDSMTLPTMHFAINKLMLSNTESVFELRYPSSQKIDTTPASILPNIDAKLIAINNVKFTFNKPSDSLRFNVAIGKLLLKPNKVDLNKQHIDVQELLLHQSNITIAMRQTKSATNTSTTNSNNNWTVLANTIDLAENNFSFDVINKTRKPAGIDYNHILATQITLKANQVVYNSTLVKGEIKKLSVKEQCGFEVKKLRTLFVYDYKHIELAKLLLQTGNTHLSNYVALNNLDQVSSNTDALQLNVHLTNSHIGISDIFYFVPELKKQEILAKNEHTPIVIDGNIKGKISNLIFDNLIVRAAKQTAIAMSGNVKGLPDVNKTSFDVHLKMLTTSNDDLQAILPQEYLPKTIQLPNTIMITGKAKGSATELAAQLELKSSDGFAKLLASYAKNDTIPSYAVNLTTEDLNVGAIIKQQPTLGKITCTLEAQGSSFNPQHITGQITSAITKIEILKYPYSNINLTGSADDGWYKANLLMNDSNVKLDVTSETSLRKNNTFTNTKLLIDKANLNTLNLTTEAYKVSGGLTANFPDLNFTKPKGNLSIGSVLVITNKKKYRVDSLLNVSVNVNVDKFSQAKKPIIAIDYTGETNLNSINTILQKYLSNYVNSFNQSTDSLPTDFACELNIKPHPILHDVLLPQLKQFTGLAAYASYKSSTQTLALTADVPIVQYGSNTIKQLSIRLGGDKNKLSYNIEAASITSGNMGIPKTLLNGNMSNNTIKYTAQILVNDSLKKLLVSGTIYKPEKTVMLLKLTGNEIIFSNESWRIDTNNLIRLVKTGLNIQQLNLSHNSQLLSVNSVSNTPNAPIDITFNNFELGLLSKIIEKDSALLSGLLNGKMHIQSFDKFAFTSDISIKNIAYNGSNIGDVTIKANNLSGTKYDAHITLNGNNNDVVLSGFYQNEQLNLTLAIKQFNIQSIEAIMPSQLKRSEGYLTGNIAIKGNASAPTFDGGITFKKASFFLQPVNNRLALNNEKIRIDNKGIYFNNFTVLDSLEQPLKINGAVYTSNLSDLKFEIDITTDNFTLLNTNAKVNPLYYGKIILNSAVSIRGTDILPIIKANATLIKGSSLTFVVQEGELSSDRGDGIVQFIDTSQIVINTDSLQYISKFRGLDINANIEVNKLTTFNIITDKKSGDHLEVSGDAILNFGIDQSGKTSLTGTYILSGGDYKASFQKIAKRTFLIKSGSSITWSGDPLDAAIDIVATYKTKAGATDLLAVELAGMTQDERNAYRKLLNYDVNLLMKGVLLKPQLTFQLDMPPKDQLAFNGMVYAKLLQINNDPNELNKQAFSLLILGRFLPVGTSGNASTSEAVTSVARNSVNQLLSDQMNAISGKYIKGAELNFNLQSNDDYTANGTTQNTELQIGLKKELFNNRMTLQLGSNIDMGGKNNQGTGQNLTGDMVMEYKLSEDGSYRFKAFRENEYAGVIDGILYRTGIGLKYSRDYDSLGQFWKIPKKEIKEKVEEGKVD